MAGFKRNFEENMKFMCENVTNIQKVVTRLQQRMVLQLGSTRTTDESKILEIAVKEVIEKREFEAFIAVLNDTGNERVAEKISDLNNEAFSGYTGAQTPEVPRHETNNEVVSVAGRKSEEVISLEAKIGELQQQIGRLTTVQKGVRQEISDKTNKVKELQKFKDQHDKLVASVTKEKEDLTRKLSDHEKHISSLERDIKILEKQLEEKNEEINDKNKQHADVQHRLNSLESQNNDIVKINQELKQQNKDIAEGNKQIKQQCDELARSNQKITQQNDQILEFVKRAQRPTHSEFIPRNRFQNSNTRQQRNPMMTSVVSKPKQPESKK